MIRISPFTPLFFAPSNDISGVSSKYIQLFAPTDKILIQVLSSIEGEQVIATLINKMDGVETTLTGEMFSLDSCIVQNFLLDGLDIGYYSVRVGNEESDVFKVTDDNRELAGTTLISYTMHSNKLRSDGVFWNGEQQFTFYWRAPGGFKDDDWAFAVNNEQFETHNGNIVELFAVESTQKSFTLGNSLGCPIWYAEHLNRLLCCSDVHFNGVRFVRKGNNVPEMTQEIAGKKSYIFKVALQGMIEGIDIDLPEGDSEGESEGGGVGYIYLIKTNDYVEPTDSNTFSALRILLEIEKMSKQMEKFYLSKLNDDKAQGLITFLKGYVSNGLSKALGGLEVGEAIDSMLAGKGTIIDSNGRIQAERMELRSSLTVMEIIFNRLAAMESNYAFSESAAIESIEERTDAEGNTFYRLTFDKRWDNDFHAFRQDDILYGQINNLASGGRDYTTSWMRCLEYTDTAANQVDVVLYPGNQVPGGVNYAPAEMMKVIRRGNATDTDRQSYWYLSAMDEKCLVWLEGVDAPILREENYYMILGKLKNLSIFDNLPINYNHSYMYARGAVIQDLFRVDFQGVVEKQERNRGAWSLTIADSASPYKATETFFDTVWHWGCKWQCLVSDTLQEPSYASTDWSMVEGDPNYYLTFDSSEGWQFFRSQVNTVITALVSRANEDITDHVMADINTTVVWRRDSGNAASDNSWAPTFVDGNKHVIRLSNADMGSEWGFSVRKVKFTCTVYIHDGEDVAENSITI